MGEFLKFLLTDVVGSYAWGLVRAQADRNIRDINTRGLQLVEDVVREKAPEQVYRAFQVINGGNGRKP